MWQKVIMWPISDQEVNKWSKGKNSDQVAPKVIMWPICDQVAKYVFKWKKK